METYKEKLAKLKALRLGAAVRFIDDGDVGVIVERHWPRGHAFARRPFLIRWASGAATYPNVYHLEPASTGPRQEGVR